MALPDTYNFPSHYAGDGIRTFNITLQDDEDVPIDLTGATIRMQLKTKSTGGAVAWTFANTGEPDTLLTTTPLSGIITFPEILSWTVPGGNYFYDLEITDGGGFVKTYLKGQWVVINDITV